MVSSVTCVLVADSDQYSDSAVVMVDVCSGIGSGVDVGSGSIVGLLVGVVGLADCVVVVVVAGLVVFIVVVVVVGLAVCVVVVVVVVVVDVTQLPIKHRLNTGL